MEPPSSTPTWLLLAFAAAVVYRALLSCLLEAFHALPSLQRRRLQEEDHGLHPLLARLLEDPFQFGLSLSLWNRILLVLLLGLAWFLVAPRALGLLALVGLALLYVWLLDGLLPVLITAGNPAPWLRRLFPFYAPAHHLLGPFLLPLARLQLHQKERQDRDPEEVEPTDDAVTALLEEGEAEGILEADDRELIRNVVDFGDTVVREVMTPRTLVKALSLDATAEEAWRAFRETRHSRLPIYEGSVDHIVGVVLLKDLLQGDPDDSLDLRTLLKSAPFVPESKPVQDLMRELQRASTQLAIVVDEYGSVSGLVTLEDLLEEVFGEIREEHEAPAASDPGPDGVRVVAGSLHVEDLERMVGCTWEREGFDTVAGLVLSRLGRLPAEGESLDVEGARLTVLSLEGSRILEIRVSPSSPDASGSSSAGA